MGDGSANDGEIKAEVEEAKSQTIRLRDEIENSHNVFSLSARKLWRYDVTLRTILVLVSVAGPTVVTYSQQVSNDSKASWMIAAILLTSFAGAATSIQAIWAFGERYKSCLSTSLSLREIKDDLDRAIGTAGRSKLVEQYRLLTDALDRAASRRNDAERSYLVAQGSGNDRPAAGG